MHYLLEWCYTVTTQIRYICGPKQTIYCGRLPEHNNWSEAEEDTDDVQTEWSQSGNRDGQTQTHLAAPRGQAALSLQPGSCRDQVTLSDTMSNTETLERISSPNLTHLSQILQYEWKREITPPSGREERLCSVGGWICHFLPQQKKRIRHVCRQVFFSPLFSSCTISFCLLCIIFIRSSC